MNFPNDSASTYLLGFCGGLNADRKISAAESSAFLGLLRREPYFLDSPLLVPHLAILRKLLGRQVLYGAHYAQVEGVILAVLGISKVVQASEDAPDLVFDDVIASTLALVGKNVVFTGEFNMGRGLAQEIGVELGATVQPRTTGESDFVIVGDIPNPSWKFGKYGNKVMDGIKHREAGSGVKIISEDTFCAAIPVDLLRAKLEAAPHLKVEGFVITRGEPDMLSCPFSHSGA